MTGTVKIPSTLEESGNTNGNSGSVTPEVMAPSGGGVHRGAGFYNSGFMMTEGPGVRSYSLTFTKAGTFEYTCAVHDEFGMKATVVVR